MSTAEAEDPLAVPAQAAVHTPVPPPHQARRRLLRVAIALAILVMLGGTASALRTHRIASRSSSISPQTVASLSLDWTAAAGRGAAAPTVDGDTIYVSTEAGLVAPHSPGGDGGAVGPGGKGGAGGAGGKGGKDRDGNTCAAGAKGPDGADGRDGRRGDDGYRGSEPRILTVPARDVFGPGVPVELARLLGR